MCKQKQNNKIILNHAQQTYRPNVVYNQVSKISSNMQGAYGQINTR